MKFCKNLQRVVELADPEWAPYWTNYKMLKKLIKELPSLVPAEDGMKGTSTGTSSGTMIARPSSPAESSVPKQHHGDKTSEAIQSKVAEISVAATSAETAVSSEAAATEQAETDDKISARVDDHDSNMNTSRNSHDLGSIGKSPGEIAFFKLLHAEFKKATHFFERAQEEYTIREERVVHGMEIMKQPNAIMVGEKWSLLAKSIYKLYKDLLLLETFAIMTYCGFSKILKKHDKVTGYNTRNAFMVNVVNKSNFANYPKVLEMISRCEQLYEQVSEHLIQDGENNLYEDERLFINMIHRLNEQVMETVHEDPTTAVSERKEARRPSPVAASSVLSPQKTTWATTSLRKLVEENEANKVAAQVSEGHTGVDGIDSDDEPCASQSSRLISEVEAKTKGGARTKAEAEATLNQKRKANKNLSASLPPLPKRTKHGL